MVGFWPKSFFNSVLSEGRKFLQNNNNPVLERIFTVLYGFASSLCKVCWGTFVTWATSLMLIFLDIVAKISFAAAFRCFPMLPVSNMYTETELTHLFDPTWGVPQCQWVSSKSASWLTNFREDDTAEISFVKFQSAIFFFFANGCNIWHSLVMVAFFSFWMGWHCLHHYSFLHASCSHLHWWLWERRRKVHHVISSDCKWSTAYIADKIDTTLRLPITYVVKTLYTCLRSNTVTGGNIPWPRWATKPMSWKSSWPGARSPPPFGVLLCTPVLLELSGALQSTPEGGTLLLHQQTLKVNWGAWEHLNHSN